MSSHLFPASLFSRAVAHPAPFASLLLHLDWPDLHALLDSCTSTRNLFRDPTLYDLILARFLPACPPNQPRPHNLVSLSIHHLHLFSLSSSFSIPQTSPNPPPPAISQTYPINIYANHATRSFFSLPSLLTSEQLAALALAHSRVVLLLQSLVHSSPMLSVPPEPAGPHVHEKLSPCLPQLSFPAPLSYSSATPSIAPSPQKLSSQNVRKLGYLTRPKSTPPPPPKEPNDLQSLRSSWRRSRIPPAPETLSYSESSDFEFAPPRRPYVTSPPTSGSSSSAHSRSSFHSPSSTPSRLSLSRSSTPTPPTSSSPSPPPSQYSYSSALVSSPHDFAHVTSPTRAPILRTYVPCVSRNLSIHSPAVFQCEDQLVRSGLWSHLSVGDVLCNLGHVASTPSPHDSPSRSPSSDGETPEKSRHLSVPTSRHPSPRKQRPQPPDPEVTGNWLVFNGTFLVPYSPLESDPVPVDDPLSLPSPFYYTHILPRFVNPVFIMRRMPPFRCAPLHLALTHSQSDGLPIPARAPTSPQTRKQSQKPRRPKSSPSPPSAFSSPPPSTKRNNRRSLNHSHSIISNGSVSATATAIPLDPLQLLYDYSDGGGEIESGVELRLVNLPTKVPTTYKGAGGAIVRRYVWIARVCVDGESVESPPSLSLFPWQQLQPAEVEGRMELGLGWQGEWILEAEGTREGREVLVEWLDSARRRLGGSGVRKGNEGEGQTDENEVQGWKWELVRERCASGRLWLKLLEGRKRQTQVLEGDWESTTDLHSHTHTAPPRGFGFGIASLFPPAHRVRSQ